jgi:hypothetical protein
MKQYGMPEWMALHVVRYLEKKYGDDRKWAKYQDSLREPEADDFYYHVAPKKNLKSIRSKGLQPGATATFSNYTNHSEGRVFLCDKSGINFWKQKVEEHLFHNTGRTLGVVVLRIPKTAVPEVLPDEVGTTDSRANSYYTTCKIPAKVIQVVG